MNWRSFIVALMAGEVLIGAQGFFSWLDGHFSRAQVNESVRIDWSFLEHGGLWADVFIVTPIFAYVISAYELDWSWRGCGSLIGSIVFTVMFVEFYRLAVQSGALPADNCTHDGKTTPAGWIHALFIVVAIWIGIQIYLGLTVPQVSRTDIIWISVLLTPFFYLGVKKFGAGWQFDNGAKWQVGVETVGLWALALFRLLR